MLEWSQDELAERALISRNTVRLIEQEKVDPRASTLEAIRRAFEKGGIEILPNDGVRRAPLRATPAR